MLICMLLHASVNAVTSGYVFRLFSGVDQTRLSWISAIAWAAGAEAIAWRTGSTLGAKDSGR